MSAQTTPITERQLDLITRAHCDAAGLIEPLLALKGGAKLKMIASLAQRGLIEQMDAACAALRAQVGPVLDELLTDAREAPTVAHVAFQSAALSLAHAGIQVLKASRT